MEIVEAVIIVTFGNCGVDRIELVYVYMCVSNIRSCVCMYVCMCVSNIRTCVCMYVCVSVTYVHVYVCMYVCQ